MGKLLLNLGATLALFLLISAPTVLSARLISFEDQTFDLAVYDQSSNFGRFLKLLKIDKFQFNLEFKTFENPSLYSGFLEVENKSEDIKTVEIVNPNSESLIFFDTGDYSFDAKLVKLLPNQKAKISLLSKVTKVGWQTATFNLKLN